MDWQQMVALMIVGITALLFLRARVRRRKAALPCGQSCGCGTAMPDSNPPRIVYRARKGEQPQIIVRYTPAHGILVSSAGERPKDERETAGS
jgi:hypothetical protein